MEQATGRSFGELINGTKPVLVDFSAEWCGPCKMMAPILKEFAAMPVSDSTAIIKIDVDKNPELASNYNIQGVPTLILFRQGKILWRQSGVVNARQLEQTIKTFL